MGKSRDIACDDATSPEAQAMCLLAGAARNRRPN